MNLIKKIIVAFSTILMLLLPHMAIAQTKNANTTKVPPTSTSPASCAELKKQFDNVGGSAVITGVPEYCSVESVYAKIMNVALFAVGILAVIVIIFGGYLYMTAGGDEFKKKRGKNVLTWAIIGLVIVICAAVIVSVVTATLVDNQFV